MEPEISFCESCGFPQGKTETEQRIFLGNKRKQLSDLNDLAKHEKGGKQALLLLTILNGLLMIVMYFGSNSVPDTIFYMILTVLYGALYFMSKHKPLQAMMAGLILYISFIALYAIVDVTSLYSGLLIKTLMIFVLATGMNSVRKAEKIRKSIAGKNLYGG